jgi:hypothetical protein
MRRAGRPHQTNCARYDDQALRVARTCTHGHYSREHHGWPVDRGNNGRNGNWCIALREHWRGLTKDTASGKPAPSPAVLFPGDSRVKSGSDQGNLVPTSAWADQAEALEAADPLRAESTYMQWAQGKRMIRLGIKEGDMP